MSKRRHNNYSVLRSPSSLRGYLSRLWQLASSPAARTAWTEMVLFEDHAIRLACIFGAMTHVQEPNSQAYQEPRVRLDWDV